MKTSQASTKCFKFKGPSALRVVFCFQDTRGVVVQTVKKGDGITFPRKGDRITVHYIGKLASNGRKFDSTYDRCLAVAISAEVRIRHLSVFHVKLGSLCH